MRTDGCSSPYGCLHPRIRVTVRIRIGDLAFLSGHPGRRIRTSLRRGTGARVHAYRYSSVCVQVSLFTRTITRLLLYEYAFVGVWVCFRPGTVALRRGMQTVPTGSRVLVDS